MVAVSLTQEIPCRKLISPSLKSKGWLAAICLQKMQCAKSLRSMPLVFTRWTVDQLPAASSALGNILAKCSTQSVYLHNRCSWLIQQSWVKFKATPSPIIKNAELCNVFSNPAMDYHCDVPDRSVQSWTLMSQILMLGYIWQNASKKNLELAQWWWERHFLWDNFSMSLLMLPSKQLQWRWDCHLSLSRLCISN